MFISKFTIAMTVWSPVVLFALCFGPRALFVFIKKVTSVNGNLHLPLATQAPRKRGVIDLALTLHYWQNNNYLEGQMVCDTITQKRVKIN